MKKILSLVLVLSMVLGSFGFAFAAEEVVPDSVKRVHAAGLFGVGGLELDRIATRAELATLVLRLHGYEDAEIEALKTASNFSDVAATSWYAPYVGLAVQEGLFTGDTGANTFRPLENAKYAELLVVILRALGYGEDLAGLAWPNGYVLKAAEVGIDVDLTKDANSTVSRLVVGATIDKALDLEVKGGEETLGQKLGLEGFEPVEPEPEELEVVGVSADNLKQVVVEFNQDVTDNEDVENVDNYVVEDTKGKTLSKIEDVEIDGEVVTLTLEKSVDNQTKAVLVVNKKVLGSELEEELIFDDFTVPVAEDAEVIGQRTIQVIFSEPIQNATNSSFEVKSEDGKTTHRVRSVELTKNGTEALIELRSNLKDGDSITLTVKNSIKDYANFRVANTEFDLEVIEDDRPIEVVGFRKATEEGITLIFNKNIKLKDDDVENFYHTSRNNIVSTTSKDRKPVEADGNELHLRFEKHLLPSGTAYIFIDGGSLEDYWGNKNNQTIRYEAEIARDTKEPAIKEITANEGNRYIEVEFDKRLDKKSATDSDNYTVVHESSGKEAYKVRSAAFVKESGKDNERKVRINLDGTLKSGKYVLEVENVEDYLGNAEAKTEKAFTVKGEGIASGDVVVTLYGSHAAGEFTIVIDYGRSMDTTDERYSVLDPENYTVRFDGKLFTLGDLDDEDDYYVDIVTADDNDKIVEITIEFPKNEKKLDIDNNGVVQNFTISRVKDANGILAKEVTIDGTKPGSRDFEVKEVEAISREEIKVTFNKLVDKLDIEDFYFEYIASGNVTAAVYSRDFKKDYLDDEDVLIIELDRELAVTDPADIDLKLGVKENARTKDAYGTILAKTIKTVDDGIAPEIVKVEANAYTGSEPDVTAEIVIEFTEDVKALAGNSTFKIEGYTVEKVIEGNKSLTILVKNKKDEDKVPPRYTSIAIQGVGSDLGIADKDNNRLESDDDAYVGFSK